MQANQDLVLAKNYRVPGDINVALLHTIIAVTALRDVLLKEIDALKSNKTAFFLELQDEKVEVARRYEMLISNLMERGSEIKNADKKLKEQLHRLQGDFGTVAEANRTQLERMSNATKKLGELIMRTARKSAETATQFAYGSSGKMARGNSASIGVNERA